VESIEVCKPQQQISRHVKQKDRKGDDICRSAFEGNVAQLAVVATGPLPYNWSAAQPGEHCALEKSIF
jgi:hypothetical protein